MSRVTVQCHVRHVLAIVKTQKNQGGCQMAHFTSLNSTLTVCTDYNGMTRAEGERWKDGPCLSCECLNGSPACVSPACMGPTSPDCVMVETNEEVCCPTFVCPGMSLSFILCIIYGIHIFLSIDWLKVRHVIINKLTILKKLGQSRK